MTFASEHTKEPTKGLYSTGYARAEILRTKGDLEVLMERLSIMSGCVPGDEGGHVDEAVQYIEQAIDSIIVADRAAEANRMEG